jgi:AraC family transcriptional regulator of adaptative response/methylated-DNA-[protein]-cysteine methyltransferase
MQAVSLLPSFDVMYRALVNRDSTFLGIFVVGVRTTGIFCRPTCPAKKPGRANVEFFATASEALHGGYRPCLRCRPMDPDRQPPELVERLRAEVERSPGGRLTDKELLALSIDPSTARRQFQRHYGMTFQAYHRARRMGLALRHVRHGGRVGEAQRESGFESASGFREAFARLFGDAPTAAKERPCLLAQRIDTPLGAMLAVAGDEGLRLLEFTDRRALERESATLRRRLRTGVVPGEHPHLEAIRAQLVDYFSGSNLEFDVPLAPLGTEFERRTWEVLRTIPIGETRSYGWMAQQLGTPGAQRAVGRANGANTLCLVIPCHRVIRADGTLCGYGGGLWRKKWLLDHERKWRSETGRVKLQSAEA